MENTDRTLKEICEDAGLTDQQINSKTFAAVEKALAEEALPGLKSAEKRLEEVRIKASNIDNHVRNLQTWIEAANRDAIKYREAVDEARAQADGIFLIKNKTTCDALGAFRTMLETVRDTFGADNMTSETIVAAIEAGSYAAWITTKTQSEAEQHDDMPPKGKRRSI